MTGHKKGGSFAMARRFAVLVAVLVLGLVAAVPVAAGGPPHKASVDILRGVDTVVAVAFPDDFPVGSLSRAHCPALVRIEARDGSATETAVCRLTTEPPLMVPENQGYAPATTFVDAGGACTWTSDYWWAVADAEVYASSFRITVWPSGHVLIRAHYPADPLACDA